jgi:oxygen-independent coproporphyrinogen-3 oxidase
LERILDTVAREYHLSPQAEITAECNPATADADTLLRMRRTGYNRLSIGLQSAHGEELRALGRLHSFGDFCRTWESARAAGFDNLSADVMEGIPCQTAESWLKTLELLCDLAPEHISAYGLTVEPNTPFGKMGERLLLPDEEEARRMYFDGIDYLRSRGYTQYEISNFAKEGYESRHNLKYWNCAPYLGFGAAAYSDFLGDRFGNSDNVDAYIRGERIEAERSTPTQAERANEFVMLQMRLSHGIDGAELMRRYGVGAERFFGKKAKPFFDAGLLVATESGYALTAEGMYVSNLILSEILSFAE